MYIFKHVKDKDNKYDLSDITFEVEGNLTLSEIITEFRSFLLASGYQPGSIDEYIKGE